FDALRVGHARCNRYGMIFVTNTKAYDALDDRQFVKAILDRMTVVSLDRRSRSKVIAAFAMGILASPHLCIRAAGWLARKAWQPRADLWAAGGRVDKLSFVIHNFMDAGRLERERVDACAFMAMTQDGPISMCLHNAKRDAFILAPIRLSTPAGERVWDPISGALTEDSSGIRRPRDVERRPARGRRKAAAAATASV